MLEAAELPPAGLYVLAYMGKVVYVGKAEYGVGKRINQHVDRMDRIGMWLANMRLEWANIRLDVLEAPDADTERWLVSAESALIRRFRPLFNETLNA